ncbi:Structural maintenance of chromosomes protein 5 [Bienertia sinuspersici]
MAERHAKRPKLSRGEDDYLPGNITEIELHNFMTFNHMKCKPGSRLNLVIGPNGSGKSSIVCAIALGLGGDPQILGRAGSIGAYVKRGEESGYIKITLRGDSREEQIGITRKIDTSNKSEWLLNGKMATKKDVVEVVQKFNIQVNNLTQFLPQDKVCEFAKLSPIDLLRATENAIGDPQLPMQHDSLIEKSSQLGRLQRAVDGNKGTLNQLKAQHAEQERDVERVRQREDLLAQVDLLKKKLPWLKYDMYKAEYVEAKKLRDDARKKFDEAAKILSDLQEPIKKQKDEKALQDSKSKKLQNILSKSAERCKQLQDDINQWFDIAGKYKDMEELKRQEESRQQRILKDREDLAAAELELANFPPFEPPRDEYEKLGAKILEYEDNVREIKQKKSDNEKILSENNIKQSQVVKRNYKLLFELQRSGADRIREAYDWLQEHRNQLKREVYGPVLLEVTVKDQSHADYLGGQVPFYIWKYIGTRETDQRADEVEKLGILDFWTPANHYSWSRSRYSHHVSASVVPVSRFKLLSCSDNSEIESLRSRKNELDETINELDRSIKSLQFELTQSENEAAKYHKQREDLVRRVNHEKMRRKEMENRINQKKARLKSTEEEGDVENQIASLADQAVYLNAQRLNNAMQIKDLLMEALSHKWSLAEKRLTAIEIEAKIRESESEMKQQEAFTSQATMQLQQCEKEVECRKGRLTNAKDHAESIVKITPEIKEAFIKMPSTIEELEAAIQDNLAQASSILLLNQNVLAEYEMRQRKIEALARTLDEEEHGLNTLSAEIDSLKACWLPALQNLVSQINVTFGRNFQEMAVAGEVSLDEHGLDFGAYGIVIKVKFRQTGQLQVLSAHHQSGGERSVSTILYLVSLQDLTTCPFRVVDEINQGMDPVNERKMFQQLVRAASQPNTPQCFLLTPKLLPDLEYSEACSILNIMNGPWIEEPAKVWSNGDCWGTVIEQLAQAH